VRRLYRWIKARLFGREWPDYPALPDRCVGGKRLGWLEIPDAPELPEPQPVMREGRGIKAPAEGFIWEQLPREGNDDGR
jgi:hypothetical protein